jgi:hypothetical protein
MAVRIAARRGISIAVVGCSPVGTATTTNHTSITLMFGAQPAGYGGAPQKETRMMIY